VIRLGVSTLGALALAACADETTGLAPTVNGPESGFLFWLDPARCIDPCTYDPSAHLVAVDEKGRSDPKSDLRFDASAAPRLAAMIQAADAAGFDVGINSPYRSYAEQVERYRTRKEIGRTSRPGHSEHQIGTAVDLSYQGDEVAASWLAEHALEFGFALSLPPWKQKTTGLRYEAWHFRYVGDAAAREIHDRGWAVVEYMQAHPERARFGDCGDCPEAVSRSDCEGLDAAGRCDGEVLRWCFDGSAAAVDCTTTGLVCEENAGGEADCAPP
jgi:hypothetical protein